MQISADHGRCRSTAVDELFAAGGAMTNRTRIIALLPLPLLLLQAFKPGRSSLQQKMEGNTPAAAAAAGQQQQGVRFPALLRRFAKMLPLYDAANMQLLGKNNYSGPFIQAVLRAAAGDK
jgi:hypothetical protein